MKYSIIHHYQLSIINCLLCLFLYGCVTKYEATGIDEIGDILVVEGIITDNESIITLSRSTNISGEAEYTPNYVDNAEVYIECDDGTRWQAEPHNFWSPRYGRYLIKTGKLNPDNKYSLKIEVEENVGECISNPWGGFQCPTKTYEYRSDFSYPIKTPEIDSIFWIKRGRGQPVRMYIATNSPDHKILYYRWSYREDWEVNAEIYLYGYPYNCWNSSSSNEMLLGNTERTVYGQLKDILTEIDPSDRRLSSLYRIIVKQNVISKRAYDYYENIKKNAGNMGSIFAPAPSELRGNIVCTTDPRRPVIGYVDVSSTTNNQRFVSHRDNLYERPYMDCITYSLSELRARFGERWIPGYPWIQYNRESYVLVQCVDCTLLGGGLQKPDDWPNN